MTIYSSSAEERFYRRSINRPSGAPVAMPPSFALSGRYRICTNSLDETPIANRSSIVELGCGSGDHLLYLKQKYGFHSSLGIDLGFAEPARLENATFKPGNLNNTWEIDSGSVDVLVAMMIFEHLFDPLFAFKEVGRVLAPTGRAFVNLPVVTSVKNRLRLLFGYLPVTSVPYSRWIPEGHWDGFHLHYFSLRSIRDLAKAADLTVARLEGVGRLKVCKNLFPSLLCGEVSFELVRHISPESVK